EARWSCEARVALAQLEGSHGDAELLLGLIELKSGRPGEALALIDDALRFYVESGAGYHEASAQLYRAAAGLALGQANLVENGLTSYLRYAASEEVLICAWWLPELIDPLLLNPGRARIEPTWAQRLLAPRLARHPTPPPA